MSIKQKISTLAAAGTVAAALALAVPAVGGTLVAGGLQQGHGTWLAQEGTPNRSYGHWLANAQPRGGAGYGHWLANVQPRGGASYGHWLANVQPRGGAGYGHWLA